MAMPGSISPKGFKAMRVLANIALLAGCLALTACAAGPRVPRYTERFEREVRNTANPGSVAARDIAFARAARDDGESAAFRAYAADDAVIHEAAGLVAAAARSADRAAPRQWTPQSIWSSCDGRTAISQGKYADPNGQWGYYLTVWERQRDYDYAYVYQIAAPDSVLTAPENAEREAPPEGDDVIVVRAIPMISGEVADCPSDGVPPAPLPAPALEQGARIGGETSQDGTLAWRWSQAADGRRSIVASHWRDGAWEEAVRFVVTANGRYEQAD